MAQVPVSIRDIEETSRKIEELRTKLQTLGEQRGQAFFQLKECQIVLEELGKLDDTDVIMKQSGPTLVRQEIGEATENIKGRIQFIENQIKGIDKNLDDTTAELAKNEETLRKIGSQQH